MKIGIDISQIVYEGTGVGEYTRRLVEQLLRVDNENEYVLFFANHRVKMTNDKFQITNQDQISNLKFRIKSFRIPIALLEFIWNRLHIFPIEWLIGEIDIFFTSDWVEPPTINAKKITTIHDLSVLKVPETFDKKIVKVHSRKLRWVVKESAKILCDSVATKNDAMRLLGIDERRLAVVYPGLRLPHPYR